MGCSVVRRFVDDGEWKGEMERGLLLMNRRLVKWIGRRMDELMEKKEK